MDVAATSGTDVTVASDPLGPPGPPVRPAVRPFSIKAAMIVPGLGLLILVAFISAEFLTSNPVQQTVTSTHEFSVKGTSLRAKPAATALKVITVSGQPPGNIVNSVAIPVGATSVSHSNNTASEQGDYSAQITLTADDSQAALVNFYSKDMKKQGWDINSTGPADHHPGAIEVLATKAGSDGFYWEMGATVSATTFGANAPAAGATSFTIELFQQPDPD
jgi:hypothetical protein